MYLADQDTDGVHELYHVNLKTGRVRKLNGALVQGGDVGPFWSFQIGPKGRNVFYVADQETDRMFELYQVDLKTHASTKLNGPIVSGGSVGLHFYSLRIDPKGKSVVYRARQDSAHLRALYHVDLKTRVVTKLEEPTTSFDYVFSDFEFGPKGQDLFFRAKPPTTGSNELYRANLRTGAVTKLNSRLPADGDVFEFDIDPKGRKIVYQADQDTEGVSELYSVNLKTGAITKISGRLVAEGDVYHGCRIGPRGKGVAYRADQDTNGVAELYHVDLKSGAVIKCNATLVPNGSVHKFAIIGIHAPFRPRRLTKPLSRPSLVRYIGYRFRNREPRASPQAHDGRTSESM